MLHQSLNKTREEYDRKAYWLKCHFSLLFFFLVKTTFWDHNYFTERCRYIALNSDQISKRTHVYPLHLQERGECWALHLTIPGVSYQMQTDQTFPNRWYLKEDYPSEMLLVELEYHNLICNYKLIIKQVKSEGIYSHLPMILW